MVASPPLSLQCSSLGSNLVFAGMCLGQAVFYHCGKNRWSV